MYETSHRSEINTGSWDVTYSGFPITTSPISVRGGLYNSDQNAGVFAFARDSAHDFSSSSWRASQTLFL